MMSSNNAGDGMRTEVFNRRSGNCWVTRVVHLDPAALSIERGQPVWGLLLGGEVVDSVVPHLLLMRGAMKIGEVDKSVARNVACSIGKAYEAGDGKLYGRVLSVQPGEYIEVILFWLLPGILDEEDAPLVRGTDDILLNLARMINHVQGGRPKIAVVAEPVFRPTLVADYFCGWTNTASSPSQVVRARCANMRRLTMAGLLREIVHALGQRYTRKGVATNLTLAFRGMFKTGTRMILVEGFDNLVACQDEEDLRTLALLLRFAEDLGLFVVVTCKIATSTRPIMVWVDFDHFYEALTSGTRGGSLIELLYANTTLLEPVQDDVVSHVS